MNAIIRAKLPMLIAGKSTGMSNLFDSMRQFSFRAAINALTSNIEPIQSKNMLNKMMMNPACFMQAV
ncbi:hypothetical protein [Poriferisphaera corsica]|uniref:hypothetical protein n=1 Tax=Poriferisphaera corsica TaxID=2528020 RepID=UPI0011A7F7DF|nr:hypothetical protein [Poriferisphaera corsica]